MPVLALDDQIGEVAVALVAEEEAISCRRRPGRSCCGGPASARSFMLFDRTPQRPGWLPGAPWRRHRLGRCASSSPMTTASTRPASSCSRRSRGFFRRDLDRRADRGAIGRRPFADPDRAGAPQETRRAPLLRHRHADRRGDDGPRPYHEGSQARLASSPASIAAPIWARTSLIRAPSRRRWRARSPASPRSRL